MSKLDELIKEHCPGGVEYKTFVDYVNVLYGFPCNAELFNSDREGIPLIRIRDVLEGKTDTYTTEEIDNKFLIRKGDILVGMDGNFHVGKWNSDEGFLCQRVCKLSSKDENIILNGFIFHWAKPIFKKIEEGKLGGTVKHLSAKDINSLQIPVPPLPVQEEIVRILDTFTSLTAELTAELTARRKQYEYYRDALLTPPFRHSEGASATEESHAKRDVSLSLNMTECQRVKLGEICLPTENIKWKENKGVYLYIDLTSVDRETHSITETMKIDSSNAPSRAQQIVKADDVLFGTTRPMLKRTAFITKEFDGQICSTGYCVLRANKSIVSPRYIYHQICSSDFYQYVEAHQQGASYPAISDSEVKRFEIPLPPLEVQERIVSVLDNFDAICADLNIGLPAEIEARKKQYEYYRDLLLNFDTIHTSGGGQHRSDEIKLLQYVFGYAVVRLGEIATDMYRGSGITRDQVTEEGISCVRYGEIYTTYGVWFDKCKSHTQLSEIKTPKYFEHGDILFAITGESVEEIAKSTVYVGNEKCLAGGDIVVLKHNQNPKYLAYALSTTDAQKQKSKGKIKSKVVHSSVPAINDISIPLPPLAEQERIVAILDRFDSLCNDISSGLPAEIAARKKQYEYYRDTLLTFKKTEV